MAQNEKKTGIAAYASNTRTVGDKAGELWAGGHLGLYREPLSQIEKGRWREGEIDLNREAEEWREGEGKRDRNKERKGGREGTNKGIKERSVECMCCSDD